jgi:endothelin-converting enzyme/putative endopeptidase
MKVSASDPLANAVAADAFRDRLVLSRLAGPVDRGLWHMTPQTVNAYYDPTMNQVTFPAAILQPPFFDPAADPAVNYGETGATIGHEMGHGFDDQGRHYDAKGRLRDWWTADAAAHYTAHAQALVRQFDSCEPIPGVHIKGQLTLGENLGDLGGLEAAYGAWRLYVARHGEPPVVDGFTGDQRFFIAYAQSWQGKQREGALRSQLLSDPHSPEAYRVNGIVRNLDAWYAAFGVSLVGEAAGPSSRAALVVIPALSDQQSILGRPVDQTMLLGDTGPCATAEMITQAPNARRRYRHTNALGSVAKIAPRIPLSLHL